MVIGGAEVGRKGNNYPRHNWAVGSGNGERRRDVDFSPLFPMAGIQADAELEQTLFFWSFFEERKNRG